MDIKNKYETMCNLHDSGKTKLEIASILGVDRGTVTKWLKEKPKNIDRLDFLSIIKNENKIYSYILGLYLGDGYINKTDRAYRLRIFLDKKYSFLNDFVKEKMEKLFIYNKVGVNFEKSDCYELSVYNKNLPDMFPQHGGGAKHTRPIILEEWQVSIIDWLELIKGLFHSDGSYYFDRDKDYYDFTNKSPEILELFKIGCEQINVNFTQPSKFHIRIGKRKDVKILKELIGTKNIMVP